MGMSSRQRMLAALTGGVPDRLPVTTHHLQDYFRHTYMDDQTDLEIFDQLGLDAIHWTGPYLPDAANGAYFDPEQAEPANPRFSRRILSDHWRISAEIVPNPRYETTRYTVTTPKGVLTTVLQGSEYTAWVSEHLIKEKKDIDLIGEYVTAPLCNVEQVNREAEAFGDRGLIRGPSAASISTASREPGKMRRSSLASRNSLWPPSMIPGGSTNCWESSTAGRELTCAP